MVQCNKCSEVLQEEPAGMPREPCLRCGGMGRDYVLHAAPGEFVCVGGSASLVHGRPGKNSLGERDDAGKITLKATGPTPTNEEDAGEICARFVRVLNASGGTWAEPIPGDRDVDWYSTDLTGTGEKLQFQVRRVNSAKLWRTVGQKGFAEVALDDSKAAREIMAAIGEKSVKYPPEQKKSLTLLLDVGRTPSHTFSVVLQSFGRLHLGECKSAGFASVWAVGPSDALVFRLDE